MNVRLFLLAVLVVCRCKWTLTSSDSSPDFVKFRVAYRNGAMYADVLPGFLESRDRDAYLRINFTCVTKKASCKLSLQNPSCSINRIPFCLQLAANYSLVIGDNSTFLTSTSHLMSSYIIPPEVLPTAKEVNATSVTVKFTKPTSLIMQRNISYLVELECVSRCCCFQKVLFIVTDGQFTRSGLDPNRNYTMRVTAQLSGSIYSSNVTSEWFATLKTAANDSEDHSDESATCGRCSRELGVTNYSLGEASMANLTQELSLWQITPSTESNDRTVPATIAVSSLAVFAIVSVVFSFCILRLVRKRKMNRQAERNRNEQNFTARAVNYEMMSMYDPMNNPNRTAYQFTIDNSNSLIDRSF